MFDSVNFGIAQRRVRLHHRPQRLRQDHHPERAGRAGAGQRRPCLHGRPRGRRPQPGARRGLPGPCADALADACAGTSPSRCAASGPTGRRAQVDEQVEKYVDMVGLAGAIDKKPSAAVRRHEAARGHRARLRHPAAMLLLDEPFGALDALTRGTIQDELLRICAETQQTVFMITHDVDEAILLADRILLMSNGPQARVAEIVRNTDAARRASAPRCTTTRSTTASATTWSTSWWRGRKDLSHGRAPAQPAEVSPGLTRARACPCPTRSADGELHEPHRRHREDHRHQGGQGHQVGRRGHAGGPEQGMGHRRLPGPDDLRRRAGRHAGRRSSA